MGSVSVTERRVARRVRKQQRADAQRPAVTNRRRTLFLVRLLSWRTVSGMIVLGLSIVLYLFLTADAFFVNSVAIGGEKYLSREEIFRDSDIAQRHVFWINGGDVAQRLEQVPNIADAQVVVGWPPNMVQILVTEREPVLTWEQGVRVWVDVNGIVMKQREDRPDLLRIVADETEDPIGVGSRIPQTVVDGALLLRKRYPNINVLLYDPVKGLGYRHGGGWTIWFGDGSNIDTKLLVYAQIEEQVIKAQGLQPGEVDVSSPDRPYLNVLWRENE
ncbi:cell division protein FtsQ/DivIB [Aggregatilinea lenta]|uniref:cell division protein FtsQ/DivIB n=1 Tax=Aggregatilinea lenta TaxID=913108 RepID=UPI0013C2DD4D|nr:FtsQ-type POTRA domain-containing protein [Aggregatilinea lenta]